MQFVEAIRLALTTIRVQKLKSVFTLLGVTIGVMFLIAVISIVEGMGKDVQQDFAGRILGVNTFTVRRAPNFNPNTTDEQWREFLRRPRFYEKDAGIVTAALPPGSRSAITSENFIYATTPNARPRQVQTVATESEYFTIKTFAIANGRAFQQQEVALGSKVIVIGVEVAEHFYPGMDPVGRELRIQGTP